MQLILVNYQPLQPAFSGQFPTGVNMQVKKLVLSALLSVSFFFGYINVTFAETVAVKGGLIFIADDGLWQ